jgi:type IV secretory pathway VirB10-like protein
MKKQTWIILAVVASLIGAGTIYAMQQKDSAPNSPTASVSHGIALSSNIQIPQGTGLAMTLQTTISTKTAQVGDRFQATVSSPVHVNGEMAIPEGSQVSGHVIVAKQPGKASGRGELQLAYDQLSFDGRSYNLNSQSQVYVSKSGTKKDVELVGGGAVAGAVLGAVLGGGAGAAKGAVVGGAAGTGASLLTRGPQLELAQGMALQTHLESMSVRRVKQAA